MSTQSVPLLWSPQTAHRLAGNLTQSRSPTPSRSQMHQRNLTRDPSKRVDDDEEIVQRRRTVSDAAQWLRAKRQSDLHRELLPASAKGARRHALTHASGSTSKFCAVCSRVLWGITRPYRCSECGLEFHRACEPMAPACLGRTGSMVSLDSPSDGPILDQTAHLLRVCIASADSLARRSLFRVPDPFAIVHMDGERFTTAVARKTFAPQWMTERDMYVTASSTLKILVFDARKFEEGRWNGFLGTAVIPAAAFIDSTSLGDGATKVLTFRLRKLKATDVVTGTVCVKVRVLRRNVDLSKTAPMTTPRADSPRTMARCDRPSCSDDMSYTLAVFTATRHVPDIIYTGRDREHTAIGFVPGQELRFVVKQTNFYGSSDYSLPSDTIAFPQASESSAGDEESEDRIHCPFFMAGFCPRGDRCPFYHGDGLNGDEVSVALAAVSMIENEDVQLMAALQASLEQSKQAQYDASKQSHFQRTFHEKEQRFRKKLPEAKGECNITVARADLFKTSLFEITRIPATKLRQRLMIRFHGEGGLDYGGLAREFFYLISGEVFDPRLGMFEYTSSNYALQISPDSASSDDHLLYFRFVGRLLGMAVFHEHFLDVTFTKSFYKHLLGLPLTLKDLQDVDPDVHRSMIWILENTVTEDMELYFVADYESFGVMKQHPLVPGGETVKVNESNKHEFVRLMVEWRLCRSCERQLKAIMAGFYAVVPLSLLREFNEAELEHLIAGSRHYNLEDWRAHTEYKGYIETDPVIQWFWEIIDSYSPDEQAEFLQFCTGSTRVPLEGFQALRGSDGPRKFCIQRLDDLTRLPSAHTCFNRLDLPSFPSKQMLQERLRIAMWGAQGFTGD
ncbi:hypothetical protein PTSG_08925 [Salpingoeca rosetta]|uniref:E3 ubiquitin-protein ligase n=1 Tax=Salpingoeca rosetta (strain ATCC 50818 / BSB-021) TaxID=946362 RepID=F2UL35_SALR5|nr:uncharacterized protein PTSG_08925 [Salpingoeca rosetta]EGD77834.1 hypothetical protein PTSG_08925 [Salpingoeca rosetta]|eukprot:XP_004990310.1 hypothetical protein PTSG_08925 [Salpingoeca rosetta]